jgi:hypothetical protein
LSQVLDHYFGESLTVELPTGSGALATLWGVAHEISTRLISIFTRREAGDAPAAPAAPAAEGVGGSAAAAAGTRPVHGPGDDFFSVHPRFGDLIPFYEFFHGDNGAGLGARQQTGWTAMVAKLIQQTAAVNAAIAAECGSGKAAAAATATPAAAAAGADKPATPPTVTSALSSTSSLTATSTDASTGGPGTPSRPLSSAQAAPGTSLRARPASRLPAGHINLGPIDTGTVLDLPAMLAAAQAQGGGSGAAKPGAAPPRGNR